MVYKSVDSVVGIITFSLFACSFSGALVPLNSLGAISTALKLLMPMTWGIDLLRQVIIDGATWGQLWADGALIGLGLQTLIFGVGGTAVFHWGVRQAQLQGGLVVIRFQ